MARQNTFAVGAQPGVLVLLFSGMALFGMATPLSKIVGSNFPAFSAAFARMTIAALVLLPFAWGRRAEIGKMSARDWRSVLAIATVGHAAFTAFLLFGMKMTTGVIGATIMSATPAVTAFAAVVFLGAAMNARKAGALGLAVAGLVVLALLHRSDGSGGGIEVWLGAGLVVAAICCEAAYTLLSRLVSDEVSSLMIGFLASVFSAILFVPLAFVFDGQAFDYSGGDHGAWSALLFWAAVTAGLAPVLWYMGVRQAPGALVAGFMSVMPVSALVSSYILLGEVFRWAHLVGFGLVFGGVILMVFEHASAAED